MDQLIKVHPMKVRDQEIEVLVDSDGRFKAEVAGKPVWARSRDDLYQALMKKLKRQKASIELPFTYVFSGRVKHGTVTGIHEGNNNLLVTWEDGHKEQIDHHYGRSSSYTRPLSATDAHRYAELSAALHTASENLERFLKDRRLDLPREAEAAVEEVVKAMPDGE